MAELGREACLRALTLQVRIRQIFQKLMQVSGSQVVATTSGNLLDSIVKKIATVS
jgi:hypothetical protein